LSFTLGVETAIDYFPPKDDNDVKTIGEIIALHVADAPTAT